MSLTDARINELAKQCDNDKCEGSQTIVFARAIEAEVISTYVMVADLPRIDMPVAQAIAYWRLAAKGNWDTSQRLLARIDLLEAKLKELEPTTDHLAHIADLNRRVRNQRIEINRLRKQLAESHAITTESVLGATLDPWPHPGDPAIEDELRQPDETGDGTVYLTDDTICKELNIDPQGPWTSLENSRIAAHRKRTAWTKEMRWTCPRCGKSILRGLAIHHDCKGAR